MGGCGKAIPAGHLQGCKDRVYHEIYSKKTKRGRTEGPSFFHCHDTTRSAQKQDYECYRCSAIISLQIRSREIFYLYKNGTEDESTSAIYEDVEPFTGQSCIASINGKGSAVAHGIRMKSTAAQKPGACITG